jgi:hypothetical protein
MKKLLITCVVLTLSACATVPDSVKVALEKEGAAINAVEADYRTSVNMYHFELIKQIDARLNDIFRYEVEKKEASGNKLTAAEVMKLEEARAKQRELLVTQAEKAKQKYLSSKNLEILKALHAKVLQYAASDKFTASDFALVLTELDAEIDKIKEEKKNKESEKTPKPNEGDAK